MKRNEKTTSSPESRRAGARRSANAGRYGVRRSSRTRIGKIARLPNEIREQINRRLQDGEPGDELLDWLNALPKAQKILAAQFGGRPISKQSLSEWKQGGYRDWVRAEEDRLRVDRFTEQAARLAGSDKESPLSERLAAVLLVEMAGTLEELKDESVPPAERWQCLRQMLREVAQMRREDNRAARLRIEMERWEREADRLEEEMHQQAIKEAQEKLRAHYKSAMKLPVLAEALGGGEMGRKFAADMLEAEHGLAPGTLGGQESLDPVKPGPAKRRVRGESDRSNRPDGADGADGADAESNKARPGQVRSSQIKPIQTGGGEEARRQDAGGPGEVEPDAARTKERDERNDE
jgi:hypothetical protein